MSAPRPARVDGVHAEVTRGVGRLVLDRPRALHALTTGMVETMGAVLDDWAGRDLRAVVVASSGGPAFCAGGDVRALREHQLRGGADAVRGFFRAEYRLDALLAAFPAPVVCLVDGHCFGGGAGLAVHSRYCAVSERADLAMPETLIGFYPDVGASWFLSRLPGALGAYLGLTGRRVGAEAAVALGLATHLVPSDRHARVADALAAQPDRPVVDLLDELAVATPGAAGTTGVLAEHRDAIDRCFSAPTVPELHERLAQLGGGWSDAVLEVLGRAAPQGLDVALAMQRWGRQHTLAECLDAELAVSSHLAMTADFAEGVRAALVDRDHRPRWGPSTFAGLDARGTARWDGAGAATVADGSRP